MLLKKFLKQKKLTQKQFSERIGITSSAINQYCSGRRKPLPNIMERIIDATNGEVTPNDFYNIDKLVVSPLKPLQNPKETPRKSHITKQTENTFSVCSGANR